MPSIEELRNAARENARQRLQADRAKEAVGSRALEQRELSKPKEEAAPTGVLKESTEADDRTRALSEAVGGRDTRPADLQTELVRTARASDDLARVLAGPLGNAAAAAFSDSTMQEEAQKTAAAGGRLAQGPMGEAGVTGAGIAGQVGQGLAMPGSMFATPGRALLSGGGLGMVDTIFKRMEEGKPLGTQDGIEEIVGQGAQAGAMGFMGSHIGRMMGNLVSRLAGSDPKLASEAQRIVNSKMQVADRAGKEMDDSKVMISSGALNHFVNNMRKQIEKDREFTPAMARHGWKAMQILNSRAAQNGDIPLRNFNEMRKHVRDSVRSARTGQLLDSVNDNDMIIVNEITKGMHRLINTLPQRKSTQGDVVKGVAAWNRMNKNFMEGAKADTIADLINSAERQARGGEKAIDVALKDEFFAFTKSKTGQKILESEYTTGQRKLIDKLALGDFSNKTMTQMDRFFGSTIFAPVFRLVRAGYGSAFEAEASRHLARKAVNSAAGIPTTLLERLNAGTKGMSMSTPAGPGLGAVAGVTGASQIPPGQGVGQRVMQGSPPPTGAPSGVPRNLAKPLPAQSQSATPQFPQVPGVTRMPPSR